MITSIHLLYTQRFPYIHFEQQDDDENLEKRYTWYIIVVRRTYFSDSLDFE